MFAVLGAAGLLIGLARLWLKRHRGAHGGEVNAAIWLEDGHLDLLQALAGAVLSIVGVAMGVALGREGAPKQAGAAAAGLLADWAGLDAPARRL
ncbi:MAG TPA: chloride channel protein, partial [Acetobacteraceae bacterium]|nr:chloride channel protein [Acetobacteraceae bacterium]